MDTEYFLLRAATDIMDTAHPYGIDPYKRMQKLSDVNIARVDEPNRNYLDLFNSPKTLVSDKIKKILEESNPRTIFKKVIIIDKYKNKQFTYWLLYLDEIDFRADECQRDLLNFSEMIIDHQKVKKHGYAFIVVMSVFEPHLIVNLEIAEKILQTNPVGIIFERIKAI